MNFLQLLLPILALASECTPLPNLWTAQRFGEPESQEETSWCFAHSVANLLSIKAGVKIEARRLALDFHRAENPWTEYSPSNVKNGGFMRETILLAYGKGVCLESAAANCERKLFKGGKHRGGPVQNPESTIAILNKLLEVGEPIVLGLDLKFVLATQTPFLHAVTLVGRESQNGECVYVMADSNRDTKNWKPEYRSRLQRGMLRLNERELVQALLRFDYVAGSVSIMP